MIRIRKPVTPPAVLRKKGKRKATALKGTYTRNASAYDAGDKTFKFDGDVYGHKEVKEALKAAQHDKCCFCEAKITHTSYGDVEHYRPKGGYRQDRSDPLGRPGYYWLAYEWTNLLLCCTLCNQRFKKNLFPLTDPSKRATNHNGDVGQEEPLLINPGQENPQEHVTFHKEIARPIDGSSKGSATIELLGLNREELTEVRLDKYRAAHSLHTLACMDTTTMPPDVDLQPEIGDAAALLQEWTQPSGEYSSMIQAALANGFE